MGWLAPAAHQPGRAGLVGTSRRCLCLPGLVAVSPGRTPQRSPVQLLCLSRIPTDPERVGVWGFALAGCRTSDVDRTVRYLAVEPVARDLHAAAHVSASSMVLHREGLPGVLAQPLFRDGHRRGQSACALYRRTSALFTTLASVMRHPYRRTVACWHTLGWKLVDYSPALPGTVITWPFFTAYLRASRAALPSSGGSVRGSPCCPL
jgi:hypothetical protein